MTDLRREAEAWFEKMELKPYEREIVGLVAFAKAQRREEVEAIKDRLHISTQRAKHLRPSNIELEFLEFSNWLSQRKKGLE